MIRNRFALMLTIVSGLLLTAITGCGAPPSPVSTTVRGKVTFQGQPVANGLIVFAPDRDRGMVGSPAVGTIGPDGSFQLLLAGTPSIPPGWYRVAIADSPTNPLSNFPGQLRRPDTSGILREILPGQSHSFDFSIEVP